MDRKPITRTLTLSFICSFLVGVGAVVAGIAYAVIANPPAKDLTPTQWFLVMLMVAAGPVWYVSLGMLAHRLGRSWLVWVGLSFIFSPIAPLIIFPLMLSHARAAAQQAAVAPAPSA